MNTVYKLVFNTSTGTWAITHEFAAARGKKSRTRVATAMAVAIALPAGASMAADSPQSLQCGINETIAADGLRCVGTPMMSSTSGGIGTLATTAELTNYIRFGAVAAGLGGDAAAAGDLSTAMGRASNAATYGTALGAGARAGANAVGVGTLTAAFGNESVATGLRATAAGMSSVALGAYSSATAAATGAVAIGYSSTATDANTVSVGNATLKRKIVNVGDATLSATSTDAVTGKQLFATNTNVSNLTSTVNNLVSNSSRYAAFSDVTAGGTQEQPATVTGTMASALGQGAHAETQGAALGAAASAAAGATALGYQAKANAANSVALGSLSVANQAFTVAVGNGTQNRRIVNMAAGTADTDAVNLGQLKGTASSVADAIGGGSTVGADGRITAPSFGVDGQPYTSVGDAIDAVDTSLTDLNDKIGNSGLVDASGDTRSAVTYDKNADGTPNYASVTLGNGSATPVQVKNVAAGTDANDAVNYSQLQAATTNPYFAGSGAGNAAQATSRNSVALGINSVADSINTVSVGNAATGLTRRITNLADGQNAGDAATVGQLQSLVTGATRTTSKSIAAVSEKLDAMSKAGLMAAVDDTYFQVDAQPGDAAAHVRTDSSALALGSGANGTGDFAVAIGTDAEASGTQSVAIGPEAQATANGALALGHAQATGIQSVALGDGTVASGANAVATGFNARAAGTNAVAMGNSAHANAANAMALGTLSDVDTAANNGLAVGYGAQVTATGLNSVALGASSSADRANVVSVGSAAQQRQIVNVAAGTADTDAVNFSQLKDYVSTNAGPDPLAVAYTDDTKGAIALEGATGTTISNVAGGEVSATSTDAINGAQLYGTAKSVADNLGGGSVVKADGTVSAPAYHIGGDNYVNVGAAFDAVDGSLTDLAGQVADSGLVDADGDTRAAVTYDKNADGTPNYGSVTLGESGTAVTLTNVAAGTLSDTSTDAVNGAQLYATNQNVAANTTSITNLDGRVTVNAGDIAQLRLDVNNGVVGLVKQDATSRDITVAADTDGTSVSFAGKDGTGAPINRTLTNVAAGAVSATSTDAINGTQLYGTAKSVADNLGGGSVVKADGTVSAPLYHIGGDNYVNVGAAFDAVDGSLTDLAGQVADSGLVDAGGDTRAAVTYDKNADGTPNYGAVTLGNGTTTPVQLKNVAAGTDANDAVNFSQLQAATTNPYFAGAGTGTAARAASRNSVALGINSVADSINTVSIGDAATGLTRRITNVAAGQGDNDAATVGQVNSLVSGVSTSTTKTLNDFESRLSALGNVGTMAAVDDEYIKIGTAAGGIAAEVTADNDGVAIGSGSKGTGSFAVAIGTDSEATGTQSVAIGPEAKATANGALAMGHAEATGIQSVALGDGTIASGANAVASGFNARATGINAVAMGNTSHAYGDNSMALGTTSSVDTAASNGLAMGANAAVMAAGINSVALGAGSVADRSNVVSVGTSTQQRQIVNVAAGTADTDAINFSQLKDYVASNGGGGTGNPLAVGYTDASKDDIALEGATGTTISNVKAGAVSDTSTDAINGAQLAGTAQSVADAIGGGATVAADGSITAPSFNIDGTPYTSVGDAFDAVDTSLTDLDGRVTQNTGDITNINTQLGNIVSGTAGLVQQAGAGAELTVGKDTDGAVVNFEGTAGARTLSGVANGTADSDAATIAQVKAMGLIDPNDGRALAALVYDDIGLARATLGGSNGTIIANLGDGLIAAGSREAVNGGQLWQMNADLEARWSDLDSRVGVIEAGSGGNGGGNGGGGNVGPGTGDDSLVIGDGSTAGGNGSIGAGNGADAGGNGSVAIGDGASAGGEGGVAVGRNTDASGDGSVAIGDGAGASGNDSVAIGHGSTADRDNEFSVGSEGNERIVSNVGAGVRPTDAVNVQQMDDRFQSERQYTDRRFQAVDKRMDRMGAISAAYAGMALNTAGLSGDNRVGAGLGNQNGRAALAVGYQRIVGEKKNVSLSLGGAFSGSERSVTAGAGFSW